MDDYYPQDPPVNPGITSDASTSLPYYNPIADSDGPTFPENDEWGYRMA